MRKIIFSILSLLFVFAARGDDFKIYEEVWSVIKLDGKRIGYSSEITSRERTNTSERWKTDTKQKFKLQRMDSTVEMETATSVVEDANGVVLSFTSETKGAGTSVMMRGHREGNEMVVEGQSQRYAIPQNIPGPAALDRQLRKLPLKAGSKLERTAFFPDFPSKPLKAISVIKGKEIKTVGGKAMELWRIDATMELFSGMVTSVWVDDQFQEKYSLIPFAGMGTLERIVTTREDALKPLESVEIFSKTFVVPSKPLANVKNLKRAVYRLKMDSPQKMTLWSGGEQKVVSSQNGEAEVAVTKQKFEDVIWELPCKDKNLKEYLEAAPFMEVHDPELIALAQNAVGDEANPMIAAQKIERFVHGYIKQKDLSVGFATALETAKSCAGDCTENAVLAAALGRVVGLPTRLVVGLGYLPTNNSFGFHMWAEAWMGKDQWLPMDSALNGFDVGHIAVMKIKTLNNAALAETAVPIFNMMDGLKIEVISME